jgi:polyketide synthase 12
MPGAATNGHRPSEEDEIRAVVASIPITRLREAGLLDPLVELAKGDPDGGPSAAGVAGSIDDMDAEALIRMTQEDVA